MKGKMPPVVLLVFLALGPVSQVAAAEEQERFQSFKSVDGKEIVAQVVDRADGKVTIERKDGKTFTVNLSIFAPEDRARILAMKLPQPGDRIPPGAVRSYDVLKRRDDITYLKQTDEPFTGAVIDLFSNGRMNNFITYREGRAHGPTKSFFQSGKVRTEGNYQDGELDGVVMEYFESGKRKKEMKYYKGKSHGRWTSWFESGQKESEEVYREGRRHGDWVKYDAEGKKVKETRYQDGRESRR